MAFANFEELCKGFCEIAGMTPPTLTPDLHGALAFTVQLRGVDVTVLEIAATRPEVAFLMAEFGQMPADKALDGWRVLMDTNLHLLGEDCAAFSCHPDTGEVVLQRAIPFVIATAIDVFQQVEAMVDLALQWRADFFLGEAGGPSAGDPSMDRACIESALLHI